MPPTERSLTLPTGLRLHILEAGPTDGPLCMLLHGFPESSYGWRHQIGPLAAAGLRVVAHDWGGAVAWYLAAAHPERVERMVVLNVPHPVVMRRHLLRDRAQQRRSWYMFFFQLPWLPEWWLRRDDWRNLKRLFRGSSRRGTFGDDELARYAEDCARPGAMRSMIHCYRAALLRPAPRPASWRVRVPTRIVWGALDTALGRDMVAPSAALCQPQAEVAWIEEAGHWVQHEEPKRINALIIQHLIG